MYGEDGWCRACGVPRSAQCGSLVLQRRGVKVQGAWAPYWQYDAICLEAALAHKLAERFRLDLLDVRWHASSPGDARQIVAPTVGAEWFDPSELRRRIIAQHSKAGAECTQCGVWRWLPLGFAPALPSARESLPPLLDVPEFEEFDLVASPEWFGDGCSAFRHALVRRSLAEAIVSASPRDFRIIEPTWA
jgi:hypothetical protein